MKKNKKKYIILLLLFVAVGMGIGYSLLQQQLKIQGTATVDQNYSMEITGIDKLFSGDTSNYNLRSTRWSQTGAGGLDSELLPTTTESYTGSTAIFNINFKSVDTIVLYKVKIKNNGNMNAKISNVSVSKTGNDSIIVEELTDINNLAMEPSRETYYIFTVKLPENAKMDADNLTAEITITIDTEQYVSSSNDVFMPKPYIYFGGRGSNEQISSQEINVIKWNNGPACKLMVSVNGASAVEYDDGSNIQFDDNGDAYFNFITYDYTSETQDYNTGDKLDMYAVCSETSSINSKLQTVESNHITYNYN